MKLVKRLVKNVVQEPIQMKLVKRPVKNVRRDGVMQLVFLTVA